MLLLGILYLINELLIILHNLFQNMFIEIKVNLLIGQLNQMEHVDQFHMLYAGAELQCV